MQRQILVRGRLASYRRARKLSKENPANSARLRRRIPQTAKVGAGGAVSEVWELGSRAVRKILRNNSGLYWIGRFPILQLSFAIDSRGGRSFSQRSAPARRH